jgi:hypothetical protein
MKKIISILLSVIILCTAFSACSINDGVKENGETGKKTRIAQQESFDRNRSLGIAWRAEF